MVLRQQVRAGRHHSVEPVHGSAGLPLSAADGGANRLLPHLPGGGAKPDDHPPVAGLGLQLIVADGAAARHVPAVGRQPHHDFGRLCAQGEPHLEGEPLQKQGVGLGRFNSVSVPFDFWYP
jgi:hypothetical protein